jgi:hypothetical protein
MGRRDQRRKPTRAEKAGKRKEKIENSGRGRIGFGDLSPMTQGVVADIARRQRCTLEEIVETLND